MKTFADAFAEKFGHSIKQEGERLFFNCPGCGKGSFSGDINTGMYHCWQCGYSPKTGGKVEGIAGDFKALEIDRDLQQAMVRFLVESLTLSDSHREHLEGRGIFNPEKYKLSTIPFDAVERLMQRFPDADLETSGLVSRDLYSSKFRPAMCLEPRRILIPYWHGSDYVSFKSRENPLEFSFIDGWKYMSPRGSRVGSHLFYRNDFSSTDLLVTEGELKAISALEARFWTAAIPGIAFSKRVMEQLIQLVVRSRVKRVFLCLDNEPAIENHYPVLRSLKQLSDQLGSIACVVALPKKNVEQKMDLDLFMAENSPEDLEETLEESWHKRKETLNWVKGRCAVLSRTANHQW